MGRGPMDMVELRAENSNVPLPLGQRGYSGSGTGSFPIDGFSSQSPAVSSPPSFVGRGSAPGMSLADSANARLQGMNNFLSSRLPPTAPPAIPPDMELPTPVMVEPNSGDIGLAEKLRRIEEFGISTSNNPAINLVGNIPDSRGFDAPPVENDTSPVNVSDWALDFENVRRTPYDAMKDEVWKTWKHTGYMDTYGKHGLNWPDRVLGWSKDWTKATYTPSDFHYDVNNPLHALDFGRTMLDYETRTGEPMDLSQITSDYNSLTSLGPEWDQFYNRHYKTGYASGGLVKNYSNGGLAQMQGISPGGLGDTVVAEQAASGPGGSSISEEMFSVSGLSEQPTLQEVGSKLSPQQMQLVVREIKMAIAGQHPQAEMVIEAARQMFGDQFLEEIALSMAGERLSMQGDGMSDSIPASLGQEQVALSEGEYVVPADTVADLGNGSTDAGGRAMDRMVQELRMQTRGTPAQRPAIDPRDFMPGRGV